MILWLVKDLIVAIIKFGLYFFFSFFFLRFIKLATMFKSVNLQLKFLTLKKKIASNVTELLICKIIFFLSTINYFIVELSKNCGVK